MATVESRLDAAAGAAFPDAPHEVLTADDDPVRTLLYDDIDNDQRFFDIFAVLILAGAAFASFNLTGRILQAQRREFGVGMALGATTGRLALRPAIFGICLRNSLSS